MLQIEGLHDSPKSRPPKSKSDGVARNFGDSGFGDEISGFAEVSDALSFPDSSDASGAVEYKKNQITKLVSGVRDANRVNVFIDNHFALSLDVQQVIDLNVKVGKILSEAELQELHQASAFGKLYQRTLEWILTRPHSAQETRTYLKNRQAKRVQDNRQRVRQEQKPLPEIQDNTISLVLERLAERGYINDQRFAEYYIENRFVKKGISKKRLRMELQKKGVNASMIDEVLEHSARNDDDELAKIIAKKARRYDRDKLVAYLCRQGFSYHDVLEAVERYESESEDN